MPLEEEVSRHYAGADRVRAILEALRAAGKDPERLTIDDLARVAENMLQGLAEDRLAVLEIVGRKAVMPGSPRAARHPGDDADSHGPMDDPKMGQRTLANPSSTTPRDHALQAGRRHPSLTRRHLVLSATAAAGLHVLPAGAAGLAPTPRQTAGPFYPLELPLDADNDLVQIAGRPERAAGAILHLGGRVLDPHGRPLRDVRLEIWQCDALGVYHHPRDPRGPADPNFQGFGSTQVTEDGAWRFRTIEPVPYPGRTPHIHFRILAPGTEPLVTQMYVAGHPLNAQDGLYQRLGARAALVTVALEPAPDLEPQVRSGAKRGLFDIVLGPDGVPRDD